MGKMSVSYIKIYENSDSSEQLSGFQVLYTTIDLMLYLKTLHKKNKSPWA